MELDDEMKKQLKQIGIAVAGSAAAAALVAGLSAAIEKLIVTNYKRTGLTGDNEIHPTQDSATISQVEATAKDTDASLAKDELKVKDGDLSATKTDAKAFDTQVTGLEGGAAAGRTKAGAADIETKALKMT